MKINNETLKHVAILQNSKDVMSFIRHMSPEAFTQFVFHHDVNYLPKLNVIVEAARHELYVTQIRDRWSWFLSFAIDTGDLEQAEWQRWFDTQRFNKHIFIDQLRRWFQCEDMKRNTFRLWGQASTGKTMVSHAIVENFVNQYQSMCGAHSDFAFEGFLNVAIGLVEEAFFIPKEAEDWKSILGGMPVTVNKKYLPKQTISRVPVLITGNHYHLGRKYLKQVDEQAFRTRMYDWHCNVPFSPKCKLTSYGFAFFVAKCLQLEPSNLPRADLLLKSSKVVMAAGLEEQVLAVEQRKILFLDLLDRCRSQSLSDKEAGRKFLAQLSSTSHSACTGSTWSMMKASYKSSDGTASAESTKSIKQSSEQQTF